VKDDGLGGKNPFGHQQQSQVVSRPNKSGYHGEDWKSWMAHQILDFDLDMEGIEPEDLMATILDSLRIDKESFQAKVAVRGTILTEDQKAQVLLYMDHVYEECCPVDPRLVVLGKRVLSTTQVNLTDMCYMTRFVVEGKILDPLLTDLMAHYRRWAFNRRQSDIEVTTFKAITIGDFPHPPDQGYHWERYGDDMYQVRNGEQWEPQAVSGERDYQDLEDHMPHLNIDDEDTYVGEW